MSNEHRPHRAVSAATLADVARAAGVSEITASRVVRGRGPISAATRAKVEAAIAAVGYVPNRLAGGLASAGSNLVGVVLPSLSNSVFPDVLSGLNGAIAGERLRTLVAVTDYDLDAERDAVAALLAWRPAALVLVGLEHRPETREMLAASGATIIELMDIEGDPVDLAVGLSHTAAGAAAARRLLARGRSRIGYVGHGAGDLRAAKRRAGLEAALKRDANLTLAGAHVVDAPSSVGAGRAALAALLEVAPELDAVVFSNDDMALGGAFHCMAAGVDVPDRLALVGFNGLELANALPKPLTTVRTARGEIGRIAGEVLCARLRGETPPKVTDVGFDVVAGGTD
ncbi:LacI family DNA-binding transcriptional regulator [Methylopila turkensis]|uniref:LacI family transcriptional regulator n=1 Tax=Methylopila turkensis TaxID=1437816 RepID=A0A9W6N787_9HYPH|nr:LacI family DNA-binding transcriptional regulator [Methylopila turkensis]GLK81009.1 LacI family transcriptional regulator [Methylopila turkensis]